eukprot:UN25525
MCKPKRSLVEVCKKLFSTDNFASWLLQNTTFQNLHQIAPKWLKVRQNHERL